MDQKIQFIPKGPFVGDPYGVKSPVSLDSSAQCGVGRSMGHSRNSNLITGIFVLSDVSEVARIER
jgi:hypothetical protein